MHYLLTNDVERSTDELHRIYKPKYMEEANKKDQDSEKANLDLNLASINPDANKDKDAKAAGRARTRSIWGRKKEKPTPA